MARPIKDGVEYFPFDVGFFDDDKVKYLRQKHKAKGMYMLIFLLCDLYRKNGYFMEWDEQKLSLLADDMRCADEVSLARLVEGCLSCGFFDKRTFEAYGVLTSAGIQRRYIRMFNSREMIYMFEEYFLLDASDPKDVPTGILNKLTLKKVFCTENPDKSTENPDKSTENAQKESKEKDTYVSQSKVEERAILLRLASGECYSVEETEIQRYTELYKDVSVRSELNRMVGWCEANPDKRKSRENIRRFINGWLADEQKKAEKQKSDINGATFNTDEFYDKAQKRSEEIMRSVVYGSKESEST